MNFVIGFIFKAHAVDATYETFMTILVWSLYWLYRGEWPDKDWNGVEYPIGSFGYRMHHTVKWLANGYFGVLFFVKGDLEYLAQRLKLAAHNARLPCSLCLADKIDSSRPWSHFSIFAAAMQTIFTNAEWFLTHPDRHPLFFLPGVGIASVVPDTMHMKHLGSDAYYMGSAIIFVCEYLGAHDMGGSMKKLWECIKKHQGILQPAHRYYEITLNMLTTGEDNFPVLKGRAACIRHLIKPLHDAFVELLDPTNEIHRWVIHGLYCSYTIEQILDSHRDCFKLPGGVAKRLLDAIVDFLAFQTKLRDHFGSRKQLFHVTIKSHYLLHIGIIGLYMNPRIGWCYSGEDLMGIFKKRIASSQRGVPLSLLSRRVLLKYSYRMAIKSSKD